MNRERYFGLILSIVNRTKMPCATNLSFIKLLPVLVLATLNEFCSAQVTNSSMIAPVVVLVDQFGKLAPGDGLRFYRDPSRQASLPQVMTKLPGQWLSFKPGPSTSFGFTGDVFWLRLRLKSAFAESREVVAELDNPRLELVDWFALRDGKVIITELSGNQRPSSGTRPRPRNPSFRLKLAAGEEVDVLARVESRSSIILPVFVYGSPEAAANEAAKGDWLALAVTGFFGSLLFLSVVLGFILSSRLQQINAVIALLLCAYFLVIGGTWARLGLPFAAELAMQPTMLMVACMDFLVVIFMREFIPPQFKCRLPGRIMGAVLIAVALEILLIPFLSYRNNFSLVALMSVIVMCSCTAMAWWLSRVQPDGGTRLLLAAWLINLAVVVNIILELTGIIPAWLPQSMAPVIYGVTISGMFLAASTQRAHELVLGRARASELEKSLAEARLLSLRYQVNPHFLFNALNSAITLVQQEPARVAPFLLRLASFLRTALRSERVLTVPLTEELEKLSAYLEIEKVRFEERLEVTLNVPAGLGQCQVPELILQPLVENAVKHGMRQAAKVNRVRLGARREGDQLELEVANTGRLDAAMPVDKNTGVGLNNLRERLQLLYHNRGRLTLTEADGWVFARLSLPVGEQTPNV